VLLLKAFCDNGECFYYGAVECMAAEPNVHISMTIQWMKNSLVWLVSQSDRQSTKINKQSSECK